MNTLKLGLIFPFPLNDAHNMSDFITHYPIKINRLFGDEVKLYLIYSGVMNVEKIKKYNIICLKIPYIKNNLVYKYLFPFLLFLYTYRYQKTYQLDIFMNVVNHRWMFPVSYAAHICGKKVIGMIGGDILFSKPKTIFQYKKYLKKKLLEKISLISVDKIICFSEALKEITVKRVGQQNKIHVFTFGIDTNKFKKTNIDNKNKIIFIGRIAPIKGLEYALEAFKELKKNNSELTFDVYGDGKLLSKFKSNYHDVSGLTFNGHVSHEKIPGIFQNGGILLMPSLSEGFPSVLLETMASGVPVITTEVSDVNKILDKGRNGIIIKSKSVKAIVNAVNKMRESDSFRKKCVDRSYEYIQKNQTFEIVRKKYIKLFNDMYKR